MESIQKQVSKGLIRIVMLFFVVVALIPIVFVVSHSLKGEALILSRFTGESEMSVWQQLIIRPFYINLEQFYQVLFRTPQFIKLFWNALGITVPIVVGQVVLGILAAYGFSKMKFPGSDKLFFLYVIMMLMPFQVTIVPNYMVLNKLGLIDHYGALILPGIFGTFSTFFLKQFMEGIDEAFMEEAQLMGASDMQIIYHLLVPMCKPIIVSTAMMVFINYWSMVEEPITFITTKSKYPLSVYLGTIASENINIGFACSVLYMLLPLLVVLYGQEDLASGFRITSLK